LSSKTVFRMLDVLGDLLRGGRHDRNTVARLGVSLPTADRWLEALEERVPGLRRVKVGKTSWLEWSSAPRLFLKLCDKCHERVTGARAFVHHEIGPSAHTSPRELCDDCTAKLAQCARILVSDQLDAAIVVRT
jgi:hypothetical protein